MIIDGHNLVPHIPGLSLSDLEDENKLVKILQEYARLKRKSIEVYFDQAPAGQHRSEQNGLVKAVYVPREITADQAIMDRLRKLKNRARNVIVVSSDRQVQKAARAAHASVISSGDFSKDWQMLLADEPELDPRSRLLSSDEVEMWEDIFRHGHPSSQKKK